MTSANSTTLAIPAEHPAYDGHFPGAPLLPGVVLLDETLLVVQRAAGVSGQGWRIAAAKFLQPVRPGEPLIVEHEPLANGSIRFAIRSDGRPVASGTLTPTTPSDEPDNGHQAG